ncbi:hypothetical protein [Phaeobacter gallaeciensis]|uniref:Uncharacterized protein n=1 Tax=Phaeobacter gallaeciensis TaxID=60890 RepID=A0AAC9Z6T9_9RHOB|nr:hypothetical protein [Phaeobacter gallaeciensis]AHD08758.1 hypothetical protein Gal_00984 [Phaeobacter gallaeciensis DSM 26640]ATE92024.1 hypothetical protein PhaeoP11_00979 [Phaeobacter gallaeciensis]ATE98152.1 hypothetical protein PhaeoP73_02865 [Phaeobacter gallaeciensis]ATF00640.1 hypothetical protein PhaeoP75_00980 [Phaeobacter gallaeciensis]ATF05071.1 hypothetical protein PhaeoP63_00979 [Phaeobacter gallaeciensis]
MKFGVLQIVKDHLATLKDDRTGASSIIDLFILFVFPAIISVFVYRVATGVVETPVSEFVSAVSVFSAILVSSQFAIHAMLSRPLPEEHDDIQKEIFLKERESEIVILGEIHSTISYLIGFGVFSLFVALSFSVVSLCPHVEVAVLTWFTLHFVLTTLIVVKRIHLLLSRSYKRALDELLKAKE